MPVAPLHQRHQHRVEVKPFLSKPVLVPAPLTVLLIGNLAQQALINQADQPVAEHLAGHSGAPLHVRETADAVERLA
jgi:hypothetical protein